jgi:hypothetical protein
MLRTSPMPMCTATLSFVIPSEADLSRLAVEGSAVPFSTQDPPGNKSMVAPGLAFETWGPRNRFPRETPSSPSDLPEMTPARIALSQGPKGRPPNELDQSGSASPTPL